MGITLFYSNILTPTESINPGAVVVSDEGKIVYVGSMENAPEVAGMRLDMRSLTVVPGFIDIHVHGMQRHHLWGQRKRRAGATRLFRMGRLHGRDGLPVFSGCTGCRGSDEAGQAIC